MKKNVGCLYGIGVGPGDPELLTLKALRIMNGCEVIAHPGNDCGCGVALSFVEQVVERFDEKKIISCEVPMTKDAEVLNSAYEKNVSVICSHLDAGEDVAFLNLGDPTIYGSYMVIHEKVRELGYEAHIISGVPSFCAAAAALDEELCRRSEELHIIPATYGIEEALQLSGTKVFMKSGKNYQELRKVLKDRKLQVLVVCNASMEQQMCYRGVDEMPEEAGYLTLVIVFDR
ncbi:MAG: precorrin-2 C(20)-methyltransferase [Butyrivibrio sp.]|nr:precorrin-2 C(20)-methyltransferase [Butyrivibrio sp.]